MNNSTCQLCETRSPIYNSHCKTCRTRLVMSTKPDRKLANIMLAYLERTTGIRRDLLVKQIKDHNETERN